jgi:Cu/Ag efflux pump CusA
VVGGLISSTLLTLFLLPLMYRHFHRAVASTKE